MAFRSQSRRSSDSLRSEDSQLIRSNSALSSAISHPHHLQSSPNNITIFLPQLLGLEIILGVLGDTDSLADLAELVGEGTGELSERVEERSVGEDTGDEGCEIGECRYSRGLEKDAGRSMICDSEESKEEDCRRESEDGEIAVRVLVMLAMDEVSQMGRDANGRYDDGSCAEARNVHDELPSPMCFEVSGSGRSRV
jgi:hypothetical protein